MGPTVVVFGVGSELVSYLHIWFDGPDPVRERVPWIHKWTWFCQPFCPGLHVNRVSGSGLLPPFHYGAACGFVCNIVSPSVSTMRWSVWLVGRIVIRRYGRYSLIVEFGQQFTFGIALCLAITAVFFLSVEHFIPSVIERILCSFKPLLLLL